jgi:hypothetical protein
MQSGNPAGEMLHEAADNKRPGARWAGPFATIASLVS